MNLKRGVVVAMILGPVALPAQPTTAVLRGGVCINEILNYPNGVGTSFDTDGSGTAGNDDEFVELFNTSGSPVDLSGLQIWDEAGPNEGLWFEFPASTILAAGAFAVVVGEVEAGGSLPAVAPPSLAFDAASDTGIFGRLSNGGENIALLDPLTGEYIQASYFGDGPVDFQTFGPPGFPGTTLIGPVEDLGVAQPGTAAGRDPDGTTTTGSYYAISSNAILATPGAPSPNGSMTGVKDWRALEE